MRLFLQTSSGQPALVLWDGRVRFQAQYAHMQRLDYGGELAKALAKTGHDIGALKAVIVDIGPGRLGATRSAVAFANGLAFARGIAVVPLSSFLILGIYGEKTHARPCLVLRSAARSQYHWALINAGEITETGFATNGEIAPKTYSGPVVVAGDASPETVRLPTLPDTLWPGLKTAPGAALALLAGHMQPVTTPVVPLIETLEWRQNAR